MTRQTEEEVGRQHQGMDRPGVWKVQEGSGEQVKMEKTGCKIICGAPMTLMVQGLLMMMMVSLCQCSVDYGNTNNPACTIIVTKIMATKIIN